MAFTMLSMRSDWEERIRNYVIEQSNGANNPLLKAVIDNLDFANEGTKATYESVLNTFLAPGGLLLTIAYSLIAVYLISGIIDNCLMLGRDIDMHVMIKMLVSLIVADVIIEATPTIINCLLGGSSNLLQEFVKLIEEAEQEKANNDITLPNMGFIQLIFVGIWITAMQIVSWIPTVGIKIMLFSTQLEIILRCIFAPIGLAGFANESHRHEAMRYLRKLIASGFYAAAIYVTIYVTLQLTQAKTTSTADLSNIFTWLANNAGNIGLQIIGPFAAIGAIGTVKGLINEALGA